MCIAGKTDAMTYQALVRNFDNYGLNFEICTLNMSNGSFVE